MQVALYLRVSTDKQAEQGVSINDQLIQMQTWAASNNHEVVNVYEESATATDDKRQALLKMIEDAVSDEHPFDAIVVHSQSRFFRNAYQFAFYELKLTKNNVKLISITQPLSDDGSGAMMRQIVSVFDEYQSKECAKHVKRCMLENAKQGYANGAIAPFGYETIETEKKARSGYKKKYEINKAEADVVRLIFNLIINGHDGESFGLKKISEYLNLNGMLNRGRNWKSQRIHSLLHDSVYKGERIFNRKNSRNMTLRPESEWIVVAVPPIVSNADFDKAASILDARAPYHHKAKSIQSPSLLTGLLKCGKCKKGMVLMTGKSGKYTYYRCSTKLSAGISLCDCPNPPKQELEDLVLKVVIEKVLDPEHILVILNELKVSLANAAKPDLQKERDCQHKIGIILDKITKLYEKVAEGSLELSSSLKSFISNLDHEKEHLTTEGERLQKKHTLPLKNFGSQQVKAFSQAMKEVLLAKNNSYTKKYLQILVDRIEVRGQNLELTGRSLCLATAISRWKQGTPINGVPSLVSEWCARNDESGQWIEVVLVP